MASVDPYLLWMINPLKISELKVEQLFFFDLVSRSIVKKNFT